MAKAKPIYSCYITENGRCVYVVYIQTLDNFKIQSKEDSSASP